MDRDAYSTPNRLGQLWGHLAGLFGAESLKRKFGPVPPAEWEAALSPLSDAQIRQGIENLTRSGTAHLPSLPEFVALCRQAREFEDRSGLNRIEGEQFDRWAIAGNQHLLAYVFRHMGNHRTFNEPETRILTEAKAAWAEDMRADDRGAGIDISLQKAAWRDCVGRAEERIRNLVS